MNKKRVVSQTRGWIAQNAQKDGGLKHFHLLQLGITIFYDFKTVYPGRSFLPLEDGLQPEREEHGDFGIPLPFLSTLSNLPSKSLYLQPILKT